MDKRSIEDINKRIENNEANIFTADEFKELIRNNETPKFEDVDVITCGTCGVMSGTAGIFNINVSDPGVFKKAKAIYLNDVPGNVGPCPNEWIGSVDLILNGTSKSISDFGYGGGFLFKDIIEGKDISIKVETIEGKIIESSTNLSKMSMAQMIGTRMAFKNYTAFINPSHNKVSSIFNAIPLDEDFKAITFSGCGDLNPLQNDPNMDVFKEGGKILLNGSQGLILGQGTRSSLEKPNFMLSGDIHKMSSEYIGGFKTGYGPEVFDTVAAPIPILNKKIYNNVLILNKNIPLTVADINGRHIAISETNYADVWDDFDERPIFNKERCINCRECLVHKSCPTNSFKSKEKPLNGELDLNKCFGCGICAYSCQGNAFIMNVGSTLLNIENNQHNVRIACRQSDRLRAKKLSLKLKRMIENKEFKL